MADLLPDFKNVLFPVDISYGAQSSSKFNTTIVTVESGYEKRIANWQDALHEFNVSHNIKTEEQASYVIENNVADLVAIGRAQLPIKSNWIKEARKSFDKKNDISDEEWLSKVHLSCVCEDS